MRPRQAGVAVLAVHGGLSRGDWLFLRISLVQNPCTANDGRRRGGKETVRVIYEEYPALLLFLCMYFPSMHARQMKGSE